MKPFKALGIQYAALPYRIEGAHTQILLITSRETHRWVIPKGWPVEGLTPQQAAAAEAVEEAGLTGSIEATPLGSYHYLKRLKSQRTTSVQVIVFPFHVEAQADAWKEQRQRTLQWFSCRKAASLVAEPSLRRLIREFGEARSPSLFWKSLRRYRTWRFGSAAT